MSDIFAIIHKHQPKEILNLGKYTTHSKFKYIKCKQDCITNQFQHNRVVRHRLRRMRMHTKYCTVYQAECHKKIMKAKVIEEKSSNIIFIVLRVLPVTPYKVVGAPIVDQHSNDNWWYLVW